MADKFSPPAEYAYKPSPVHLTPEDLADLEKDVRRGLVPPDAIEQHFEAEARSVFGHDAKKDRHGNFVEQGQGSKGHETANHFAALLKAEREGYETEGSYEAAVRELWQRDPERAKLLKLQTPAFFDRQRTQAQA